MNESYRTLEVPVQAQFEVKRSRFLCHLAPAAHEDEARAVIDGERRRHADARHHCSAFVLGPEREVRRGSDDGEPAGTAGMPMLDVLVGSGLTDVVAVVTRWFGGTLLGAGGLVKAYGVAVTRAVESAQPVRYDLCTRLHTTLPVADVGRVEHALRLADVLVSDVDYATRARQGEAIMTLAVRRERVGQISALLAEVTGGVGAFAEAGEAWMRR